MKISLVGESYDDRSLAVSAQSSVNVFPQLIADPNEQTKNKAALIGAPGKHALATLATDVRGVWSGAGRLFVASGLNLIELDESGAVISSHAYAGVNDGFPVQLFANGIVLMMISGGFAYICPGGGTPFKITTGDSAGTVNVFGAGVGWVGGDQFVSDGSWVGKTITINGTPYVIGSTPDPPTATQLYLTTSPGVFPGATFSVVGEFMTAVTGGYLDGTFFVQRPPTVGQTNYGRQINYSPLLDNSGIWDGLAFFSKESNPDATRGILCDNEQIYLFGAEGFEVWQSDPNALPDQNPFLRIPGATGRYGAISPWGQVQLDGVVYFMGGDDRGGPVAYAFNGFTPVRVSTHGEEAAWNAAGLGLECVAYAYSEDGVSFWVVNFGAQTWAYNPETGAWSERRKWTGSAWAPYLTNLHTYLPEWKIGAGVFGAHITACTTGPAKVYQSSVNFYDDDGADIKWLRALGYLYANGHRQFFGRLELEMETGTAIAGAPVVTMDYSDDRGVTFINPRTSSIGAAGATGLRVWWNRNGSSLRRIFRLSSVGQSKVALVDLQCDITIGSV